MDMIAMSCDLHLSVCCNTHTTRFLSSKVEPKSIGNCWYTIFRYMAVFYSEQGRNCGARLESYKTM